MSRIFFLSGLNADSIRPVDLKMTESSSVALADVKEPIEDVIVVFGVEYDLVCAILYLLPNLISSPEKVSIRYAKLQQSRVHGHRTLLSRTLSSEKLGIVLQSLKPRRDVAIQSQRFVLKYPRPRIPDTRVGSNKVAL